MFWGMDSESVQRHVEATQAGAERMTALQGALSAWAAREDIWRGPDAETFRTELRGWLDHSLRPSIAALQRSAGQMLDEVDGQDRASEAGAAGTLGVGAAAGLLGYGEGVVGTGPGAMTQGIFSLPDRGPDGSDGIDNDNGEDTTSGRTTEHTRTEEEMDDILHQYQVEDDEMVEWQLSWLERQAAEAAGIPLPAPQHVTATEAAMLDALFPTRKQDFSENSDLAFAETSHRYGDAFGNDPHPGEAEFNDDHADAFRHAYVSALTSKDFGEDWSTDYWTAHERVPGNDGAREAMDLHNNEVGRRIASENPGASDAELADLVEQAVADGEMVVIDGDGNLRPSNAIDPSQAGHPDPDAPALPGHEQERQRS